MYSFAQREDFQVWDEPLYGHFLRHSAKSRPDREETLAAMPDPAEKVIQDILLGPSKARHQFFKQISNHLDGLNLNFCAQLDAHIFFIRDPREIIRSYSKVIEFPDQMDIAISYSAELLRLFKDHDWPSLVLHRNQLLNDPESCLEKVCEHLNIDFDPAMLSWPAGARPEDGPWSKFWYAGLHKSTGFSPLKIEEFELAPHLEDLAAQCKSDYNYLLEHCMDIPFN
jgi:hypothetical protein